MVRSLQGKVNTQTHKSTYVKIVYTSKHVRGGVVLLETTTRKYWCGWRESKGEGEESGRDWGTIVD